jgi:hypothetical protein
MRVISSINDLVKAARAKIKINLQILFSGKVYEDLPERFIRIFLVEELLSSFLT